MATIDQRLGESKWRLFNEIEIEIVTKIIRVDIYEDEDEDDEIELKKIIIETQMGKVVIMKKIETKRVSRSNGDKNGEI